MHTRAFLPAIVLLVISVAGCGSSKLEEFPLFPEQKARLGKSMIIADFLILKATGGDESLVDLGETKAVADTILRSIQNGAVLASSIFIGVELVAVLIGYLALGGFLGLRPPLRFHR